ncbi:hypothetical protein EI613_20050 [Azospirillum sp. 412522]|nr:hypothetical protein [Azospirillum sp. 412522]MBY6264195.1 hypothetical protein [Azospirillum sp. 412522]
MPRTPDSANGQTDGRLSEDRQSGQDQVPKPPSRTEVEEISRSQEYLTDDWTGDGGKPQSDQPQSNQGAGRQDG